MIFLSAPIVSFATSPDFTLISSPSSRTVPPGGNASFTINLSSINGFSGPVNLIPSVNSQPQEVAVNAKMNRIYVADWQSSLLTVIDGSTDKIIASIPVLQRPDGVVVNPSTNQTYVASYNSRGISVIDDNTNTLAYNIDAPAGLAIAVNPVTNRIYIANTTAVTVIDASTGLIVDAVTVGFLPTGIAVNPATNRIYVGSEGADNVSVIDGSTDTVVATIQVTTYPSNIAVDVNPKTDRIYAAILNGPVFVIDGTTNTIVGSITVHGTLNTLTVNPTLNEVYISDQRSYYGGPPPDDKLVIINATSNSQIANVTVGAVPSGIGVDQTSGRVYVDNENSDTMSVIDASTYNLVDTIILDPTISANTSTVTLSPGGTATSTVTVTTYSNTRFGTYYFYIYGNSSTGIHSITISLTVGDFSLFGGEGWMTVPRGFTISTVIDLSSLGGDWTVNMTSATSPNLTDSSSPDPTATSHDLNVHFTPSTVTISPGGSAVSTMAVGVSSVNPIANYTLTITGTSGAWSHSFVLTIKVVDFTVSADPLNLTIQSGSSGSLTIEVAGVNGYSGYASLSLTSTPAGLSCDANSTELVLVLRGSRPWLATAASLLTCSGAIGNYTVIVTVNSYGLIHSITIPVTVRQASGGGPTGGGGTGGESIPAAAQPWILPIGILVAAAAITATMVYIERRKRRKSIMPPASPGQDS